MSGVKKYDYSTLTAAIRSYTEVDDSVFTQAVIDEFIMGAEFRIYQELPMDSARFVQEGTLATDQTHPTCLLYTSPSPRDGLLSRMPSSA